MMEFNMLPLEIHLKILPYLSIKDVMKIRLVCKQWANLINSQVKFKRLICNQSNRLGNCSTCDFQFASTKSFQEYASNDSKFIRVKYLNASLKPKYAELADAFDFLNSFKSLKETRFECYFSDYPRVSSAEIAQKKQFVVNLDRLERAEIYLWSIDPKRSKISIVLNLPCLLHLRLYNSLKLFKIGFPGKTEIRTSASDMRSISASFLEKLPSLRELHLDLLTGLNQSSENISFSAKQTREYFTSVSISASTRSV